MSRYRERHPDGPEPAVRWLPFQLNPDMPDNGMARADYVMRKFGARGGSVYSRVAMAGKQVGIDFAFDSIKVQPSTVDAHRLMRLAEKAGRQDEMAEALFRAYFIEGVNLNDKDALADIAARAGLDRSAARDYLSGDEDRASIAQADVDTRVAGVSGVPFFIFNNKVGVSGAQDAAVLLDAMEQSLQKQE